MGRPKGLRYGDYFSHSEGPSLCARKCRNVGAQGGATIDSKRLVELLRAVQSGQCSVEQALDRLRLLPFEDLDFATLDHHRSVRQGFPEVVLGQGKTTDQIAQIASRLSEQSETVLITRVGPEAFPSVQEATPAAVYHPLARAITIDRRAAPAGRTGIVVVSAGTADLPVADEAAITAGLMGNNVLRITDVGVAGLHRLFEHLPRLLGARVLVVVAGMDGALPSVIGGLVAVPVIAVPTSVGYGASFGGLAALLTMLNSCATGVAVVNIDNGFGAGCLAGMMNRGDRDGS
ncbi:MAG: nickel pincer cofactor biosynthesis protein LarB [Luteitalea sp.]|nr:nickel pincer cofactor biosynthesis protein LarB [Luteitalea sp.]